jgi:dUTP pyrophosphatase
MILNGEELVLLLGVALIVATIHPLLIKRLDHNAKLLIRGSDLAAGIDIMAKEDIIVLSDQHSPINTGIALAAPPRSYARIAPQSSLVVKYGIDIGAGVIDKDYQGETKVVLINNSTIPF